MISRQPQYDQAVIPPTDANLNSICLEYSYQDIVLATKGFAKERLLGQGAYGSVYRGQLRDGTDVAVKVLHAPKEGGFKEEVQVLSRFRHPNLVLLLGFARHGHQRFLVYELLEGGDVASRLVSKNFDFKQRVNVALDAALGLSHLHNATPKVFHRDCKSLNILIDKNGTARVADFGLALLTKARRDTEGVLVEQCSGTVGYADPQYIATSVITEKREVYSFGMVLLELLTGRPPAVSDPKQNGQVLFTFNDQLKRNVDAVVAMTQWDVGWPPSVAKYWTQLALACVQDSEVHRPLFVEVVSKLRKLQTHLKTAESTPLNQNQQPPLPQPQQQQQQQPQQPQQQQQQQASTSNPFGPHNRNHHQQQPPLPPQPQRVSAENIEQILDRLFGPT